MLRDYVWAFAKRYVVITPSATQEAPKPWKNAFQYPDRMGRILTIFYNANPIRYEQFNGYIYADSVNIELRYIEQFSIANDTAIYPPDFAEACSAYLAAELAVPLTQNRALFDLYFAQYKELIAAARHNGAIENVGGLIPTTWLDERDCAATDVDISARNLAL